MADINHCFFELKNKKKYIQTNKITQVLIQDPSEVFVLIIYK